MAEAKFIDSYYIPKEFREIRTKEQIELIYKICRYDPEKKAWRGIAQCVREFQKRGWKISETTIKRFLKQYPEPPVKPKHVAPMYLEQFRESEIVKDFKKSNKSWKKYLPTFEYAWLMLDKKHPLSWTRDDLVMLFTGNFPDAEKRQMWIEHFATDEGRLAYERAVALRQVIFLLRRYKPDICFEDDIKKTGIFGTKGLKSKGKKRTWYLHEDDIHRLIQAIDKPDVLVLFRIGIECGARIGSITRVKVSDIDFTQRAINMYESKVRTYTLRYFHSLTMSFIRQYISDYPIKNELFPRPKSFYESEISKLGKLAGLPIKISSHIMKHTFVSLASHHGVSLQVVSEQSGTVPTTLMEYYMARNDAQMKHELIGAEYDIEPFHKLVEKWDEWFRKRYEELRGRVVWIDGFKPKR
jgi:integrase